MKKLPLLLTIVVVGLLAPPIASAQTVVTLDDPSPPATDAAGGGYTVDVGLTNITDQAAPVAIARTSPKLSPDCGLAVTGGTPIPAATKGTVTLTFDSGCTAADAKEVILRVGVAGTQTLTLKPESPTAATPDWTQLWAFVIALGGGALFVLFVYGCLPAPQPGLSRPLTELPTTWSLSDSLVTNVTVVGGTLTGVVGSSDVVKAFLGTDADSAVALATVGAAIAAGILALAVVVLMTLRRDSHFTVLGLLGAAAVTLAGAFGEIYVVWQNGRRLALGGWQHRLGWIALGLGLLLLAYTWVSLREAIREGLSPSVASPASVATVDLVTTAALAGARSALAGDADQLAAAAEPAALEHSVRESIQSVLSGAPAVVLTRRHARKSALL